MIASPRNENKDGLLTQTLREWLLDIDKKDISSDEGDLTRFDLALL
jgi:hypothetical protein